MRVLRFIQSVVCFLILCCGWATADSIQLRSGRHLQGKYIGGTTTMVGFMSGGTVEYFSTTDVLVLVFDTGSEGSLNSMQPNPMSENNESQGQLRPLKSGRSATTKAKLRRAAAIRQIAD